MTYKVGCNSELHGHLKSTLLVKGR